MILISVALTERERRKRGVSDGLDFATDQRKKGSADDYET